MTEFSQAEWSQGIENMVQLLGLLWRPKPQISVSEYAEKHRTLPQGTPFPGPWRNDRTPYLVEPMDNMSAYSGVQRSIIVKGHQLGFTAAGENAIAYWMDISPAQIIYITATESLAEKWATKRLDPLIDSCGIRHKIRAQTLNKKTRRTGDKTFRKEFFGGWLEIVSAQSPADLRQDSARVLVRDEIDGAPRELKSGEGDWLEVSYARTSAFGSRKKILDYSTPTTFAETAIWPEYELGDQRRYFVPCPHCGAFQKLEWAADDKALGMKWTMADGRITRVWYVCEHCHGEIENHHKGEMLKGGEWRATSKSYSDQVRSYHISSLYSPVGMLSWEEMVQIYLKASEKPDGMRAFVNLYLGMPYEEKGIRPKAETVSENRGLYRSGTIPDGVLYLTAAVDVQQGWKNDPERPPRLEMEVCGHGAGYRTWSIEYRVFSGAVDDPLGGAWEDLVEYWRSNKMTYQSEDGRKFPVKMVLIDSGDGTSTEVTYRFCSPWQGVFPCKGLGKVKRRKGEAVDEDMPVSFRRFRVANVGSDKPLYEVNTNHYKNLIYSNLARRRNPVPPQKPGFCDFPVDYGKKYFDMLTAEDRLSDGTFHHPPQRANEALDCFDSETEVLTDRGWKRFEDLDRSEAVATVRLDGEIIEYQRPTEYIRRQHDGDMIHIHGRRIDIMTTENHRMVAIKKKLEKLPDGSEKWNLDPPPAIVLAKDLTIHHQLLMAAKWEKRSATTIIIPEWKNKFGRVLWPKVKIDAGDWAEFLGWFVSEGSTFRHEARTQPGSIRSRTQIDQNPGPKAEKIEKLLNRLPWKFRRSVGSRTGCLRWTSTSAQLYDVLEECGRGVANKKVPQWIKNSSGRIIKRFLFSAVLGDGWIQETSPGRFFRTYSTISKQLADDIQELFIKAGSASNIKERQPQMEGAKLQYHVTELGRRKASLDGGGGGKRKYIGKRVDYSGFVYCVSVPNGTLICRRNGRSFIAGNCRVYNLCAGDAFLHNAVLTMRADAKTRGAAPDYISQINSRAALEMLDRMNEKTRKAATPGNGKGSATVQGGR